MSESENRITQLSDAVANQIKAGEVVERPASVVKELTENSIDAKSTRIRVEIEEGGQKLIRVIDNGHGMNRSDAELCLSRHATSKIKAVDDLTTVRTLGFRGEAIPSIASVSRFMIITQTEGSHEGTKVVVEGGHTQQIISAGAATGTTIEVKDLFYNVPARRKFLKRPATEMSHISDAIARLAMAHPHIGFKLSHNGRTVLDAPPETTADPKGRLGRILGAEVAQRLHEIPDDGETHLVNVRGYISEPELSERTTRGINVFVNGRFVRDRTIQHAITDGYRTMLERGRHPVVILFVELDPAMFDVNVHPQKTEVRFSNTGAVHRAVSGALSRTLAAQPWLTPEQQQVKRYQLQQNPAQPGFSEHQARVAEAQKSAQPAASTAPAHIQSGGGSSSGGLSSVFGRSGGGPVRYPQPGQHANDLATATRARLGLASAPGGVPAPASSPAIDPSGQDEPQLSAQLGGFFGGLEPVGQVMATYLVCQAPGRMVVIDQHAAHERIAFERMRKERKTEALKVQPLLVPLTMDLDPARAQIAHDEGDRLKEIGIEIEHFGGPTWLVKSCPAALGPTKLERMVLDLLDELKAVGETTPMDEAAIALMSCAACHAVVRAGDRLSNPEIKSLLHQMDEIDFGAHCPHGRPVFVEWSEQHLAKLFHRE